MKASRSKKILEMMIKTRLLQKLGKYRKVRGVHISDFDDVFSYESGVLVITLEFSVRLQARRMKN